MCYAIRGPWIPGVQLETYLSLMGTFGTRHGDTFVEFFRAVTVKLFQIVRKLREDWSWLLRMELIKLAIVTRFTWSGNSNQSKRRRIF